MISRRSLIQQGVTATALIAAQCTPTEAPAAEHDPFVERWRVYLDEVDVYNAGDDDSDVLPDMPLREEIEVGLTKVSSVAGAIIALRHVLDNDCIGDMLDITLVKSTLAYLEGRAFA